MEEIKKTLGGVYQGYIWLSDAEAPIILDREPFPLEALKETEERFIVEAQLFDPIAKQSIRMIFSNNTLSPYIYDLEILDTTRVCENQDVRRYVGNRMNGKMLYFKQYWKNETDENCAGMDTLKPAELVFIGFTM